MTTGPAPADGSTDLLLIEDDVLMGDTRSYPIVIAARWLLDPPKLALPTLTAYARAAGHSVRTVSSPNLPWRENQLDDILLTAPKVVGITTVAIFSAEYIARLTAWIRQRSPSSVIVLGGHGAQFSEKMRGHGDVFISGHGEKALAGLVSFIKAGGRPADFPGAVNKGGVIHIEGGCRYEGYERILPPDWSDASTASGIFPIEASRGCKFNCVYCNFPGKSGQAFRDPLEIVEEMKKLHRDRGAKRFEFVDASTTSDAGFMTSLCAEIRKTGIPFRWKSFAKPNAFALNPEMAADMYSAGCRKVFMGIESIHDHILSLMRRGMDRACVERALDSVASAGIKMHANFIIGFPGETEETVEETVRFVKARAFSMIYFCVFMMSGDMRDIAAREPEKYLHLSGEPPRGWKHDTMDYEEACRLSSRAALRINLSRMWLRAFSLTSIEPDPAKTR